MHIIDFNALSEMLSGDTDKVKLVLDALVQRIPEWQAEAKACAEKKDTEETRQLCHRIRGAAGSVKADNLTRSVTHLGDIIKAQQFDKEQAAFDDLNNCLEELLSMTNNQP